MENIDGLSLNEMICELMVLWGKDRVFDELKFIMKESEENPLLFIKKAKLNSKMRDTKAEIGGG